MRPYPKTGGAMAVGGGKVHCASNKRRLLRTCHDRFEWSAVDVIHSACQRTTPRRSSGPAGVLSTYTASVWAWSMALNLSIMSVSNVIKASCMHLAILPTKTMHNSHSWNCSFCFCEVSLFLCHFFISPRNAPKSVNGNHKEPDQLFHARMTKSA